MKKLRLILIIVFVGFVGNAQIVNIPDANFKATLLSAYYGNQIASTDTPDVNGNVANYNRIDINNDGEIQVSEALAITHLDVFGSQIADLTGIESFSNLQFLGCSSNQLTNLNISGLINIRVLECYDNQLSGLNVSTLTNLQYLDCRNNALSSLNVNGLTGLKTLYCFYNQLTSLNVNGLTNLQSLQCYSNHLPALNISGLTNLQSLNCAYNQIPSLNVSGLTNLWGLYCNNNQIPSLNLTGLTNLLQLDCSYNQLPGLNLNGLSNLQGLDCSHNQLPTLDVSQLTNLTRLVCDYNQLPGLNVNGLNHLDHLGCSNNQIPSLDVSGLINLRTLSCYNNLLSTLNLNGLTHLQYLYCGNNQLTTLFVKNGSIETDLVLLNSPNLEYICADEAQIASIQTTIAQNGYINCHVNSYCSFTPGGNFYTIQGNNRYDNNSNGCDATDINFPNLKLSFTDGTAIGNLIADATGAYHYDVQAGTQTIIPILENPTYFNISPTTATVTFPATTSPFTQDFCITGNGNHNDLEVVLFPLIVARPGFDVTYKIIYKNKGTAAQSGILNLAFDDARLDFVSAVPAVSSQTVNNLNWSFSNLLPFEAREILVTLNVNSPTETPAVNSGDVLTYTASVVGAADETPADNVSALSQTVTNSLDPNNKTCLEGTTVSPSIVDNYVHYIVRFENDGTANAQNIVLKDVIDVSKFDINSLIPLSGSASYVTRIKNTNQVEFIFQNINLPFTAGTNTGYLAFKIKTKPTLVVGDTFSNGANIYFDYNFPITTNAYTTTIAALSNQDFDFGSAFTLSPVPAKNRLTITAKQDMVLTSLSIYNTLGQVVQVNTNPIETIDISGLQSGSYFIRITSDKGSATGKFIKE